MSSKYFDIFSTLPPPPQEFSGGDAVVRCGDAVVHRISALKGLILGINFMTLLYVTFLNLDDL